MWTKVDSYTKSTEIILSIVSKVMNWLSGHELFKNSEIILIPDTIRLIIWNDFQTHFSAFGNKWYSSFFWTTVLKRPMFP